MKYQTGRDVLNECLQRLDSGEYEKAETLVASSLGQFPNQPEIIWMYANVFISQEKYALAAYLLETIKAKFDKSAVYWMNLGICYHKELQLPFAKECLETAVKLAKNDNEFAKIYSNMSSLYVQNNTPDKCIEYSLKALEYDPTELTAKNNAAYGYLEKGDWVNGWKYYMAREITHLPMHMQRTADRNYHRNYWIEGHTPLWDGTKGKNVVVYGEQGLGDEIMFASIIPDLIKDCNRVYFDCHPRLLTMFKESFPELDAIFPTRKSQTIDWPFNMKRIDYAVPIGNLGMFYRNKDSDFPGTPYLKIKDFKPTKRDKFRVAISWAGGTKATRADYRYIPLDAWKPLFEMDNIEILSMQYTPGSTDEISKWVDSNNYEIMVNKEFENKDRDYDYFGRSCLDCDLIITTCTSLFHIAGALGVPCWVFVPDKPDFRLQVGDRTDIVWYNSLKLYRQNPGESWDIVMKRVCEDLKKHIKQLDNFNTKPEVISLTPDTQKV